MKKLTLVSALCLAMFAIASCGGGGNGKEDIDPEKKPEVDPEINEPTVTLNPRLQEDALWVMSPTMVLQSRNATS